MTLEQIIQQINEGYRAAQRDGKPTDEMEMTRDFLLCLPSLGLTNEEIKTALCCACNIKNPAATPWNCLRREVYRYWLLDIGEEEKPIVSVAWGCWLNVDSREISTVKPYDAFVESDKYVVWVEDYRIFGEICWKDIVKQ